MIGFILIAVGITAGAWLEKSGRRMAVFKLEIYGALFVAGMFLDAAASLALIKSVLPPTDLPIDRLVSLPLSMVLVIWMLIQIGILIGTVSWILWRRLKHNPA